MSATPNPKPPSYYAKLTHAQRQQAARDLFRCPNCGETRFGTGSLKMHMKSCG